MSQAAQGLVSSVPSNLTSLLVFLWTLGNLLYLRFCGLEITDGVFGVYNNNFYVYGASISVFWTCHIDTSLHPRTPPFAKSPLIHKQVESSLKVAFD